MLNPRILRTWILITTALLAILFIPFQTAAGQSPVVHAILFFSPSCPHCHKVITEDLPPLQTKYAEKLDILQVDTTTVEGADLYNAAVDLFKIAEDRRGVPTMIVADTVLVGSMEIPAQLPGIIEKGLAAGGIDWPKLPKLENFINNRTAQPQPAAVDQALSLFQRDLLANSLAVLVLIGLLISLIYNLHLFDVRALHLKGRKKALADPQAGINWFIPALLVAGLLVAIYMTYVEATDTTALCGPVGDCNTVQQSPYAMLFGIISVGAFGMIGYVCLAAAWFLQHFGPQAWRNNGALIFFALAIFGVAFATYLTTLEPFFIGASCMWCLTTAVIMALLLWLAAHPAIQAWNAGHVKAHKRH